MKTGFHITAALIFIVPLNVASGQSNSPQPIRWNFTAIPLASGEAKLVFTANLEDGWHVYSQFLAEGGPMPTTFSFVPDPSYELKGKVDEESTPERNFDNIFMMEIVWFKKTAVFSQVVKLKSANAKIRGKVEYMGCNDFMCLPPNEENFSIEVKATASDRKSKGK